MVTITASTITYLGADCTALLQLGYYDDDVNYVMKTLLRDNFINSLICWISYGVSYLSNARWTLSQVYKQLAMQFNCFVIILLSNKYLSSHHGEK